MRQGWKLLPWCAALALITAATAPLAHASTARSAATSKSSGESSTTKSKNTLHQFTGVVTDLDESSITVEKGGKKPKTMVFSKHEEMKTAGDLEEDARVTVYYREKSGRPVAYRVVVKPDKTGSSSQR